MYRDVIMTVDHAFPAVTSLAVYLTTGSNAQPPNVRVSMAIQERVLPPFPCLKRLTQFHTLYHAHG